MKHFILKSMMVAMGVLLSFNAHAYDAYVNGIYYDLNTTAKTATVTRGTNKYTGAVSIPSFIAYNDVLYNVTDIGDMAFKDCRDLDAVTIPYSITSIGNNAFAGCYGLAMVHIEDLATWCNISFGKGSDNPLYYGALYHNGEQVKDLVIPNSVTSIGDYAFSETYGLESVTFLNCVTTIGHGAFSGCNKLTTVTFSNSIKYIGDNAFSGCALTSVTIPNSVTSIGWGAFSECNSLNSVTIPNSVTSIGGNAFKDTPWIANMEDGLVYIGRVAYAYKGDMPANTNITIKDGTISISGNAFRSYNNLSSVAIPNSVTTIGNSAFYGCSGLTSMTIPYSVTSIGSTAFSGCI